LKEQNICPCAGERPEKKADHVKLTSLVAKAGCASKINQNDLKRVLKDLPISKDPRILVGSSTCDDAGVYKLDEEIALVQTIDVFTPTTDDPYVFGQIAAANSLSDVYAMGGRPITALSLIGFPIETVDHKIMTEMLRGGMEKMLEAGVAVIGGHSINDKEPKLGYAVTGAIQPDGIVTNAGAKPGDILILTKPIGVGIIAFAAQLDRASDAAIAAASESMTELNNVASEIMMQVGVNAATDVTGFGLLGHLSEMAIQSRVTAEIYPEHIPVFKEVLGYVSQGLISGGIERNREYAAARTSVDDGIGDEIIHVLYDPQTSGGLLISVSEEKAEELLVALRTRGVRHAFAIGRIVASSDGRIIVRNTSDSPAPQMEESVSPDARNDQPCCGSITPPANGSVGAKSKFADFMRMVNAEGAISTRTKELMALTLSVLSKCEPCVKIHLDKARSMGITEDEIDEAVWMAVSFGGVPTMMFYNSIAGKP
jgi:selenide,water dikinase